MPAAGYLLPLVTACCSRAGAAAPNWRQAVAEYGLTTAETLAVIADDPAALGQELAAVGAKLSLDLTAESWRCRRRR